MNDKRSSFCRSSARLQKDGERIDGSVWGIPQELYEPILQDAVILKRGADNVAAQALFEYLNSEKARAIIVAYGYDV